MVSRRTWTAGSWSSRTVLMHLNLEVSSDTSRVRQHHDRVVHKGSVALEQ
jgi:hypothetical protein